MTAKATHTARISLGAALAALLIALGSPAVAHTSLIDSTPGAGESVSELERIRLEFSDGLLEVGTVVTVVDGNDQAQDVQHEHISDTVVEAEFPFVESGDYVIQWRVVADDGHPIEGEIAFSLDAVPVEPEPSASPEPAHTPQAQELPSPSPSPSPTTVPDQPGADDEQGINSWLAAGVALLAAALVTVVWMLTRKREPKEPEVS